MKTSVNVSLKEQHNLPVEAMVDDDDTCEEHHVYVVHAADEMRFGVWKSVVLSAMYIFTSIGLFLSIRHLKNLEAKGLVKSNSTTIVMLTELAKLLVSTVLKYLEDGEMLPYSITFGPHRKAMWRMSRVFLISSVIYAMYNNLTYISLHYFDPGTVQMVMQTRIIILGFLYSSVLKRPLGLRKWLALGILTIGLFVKYYSPSLLPVMDGSVVVILVQAFLSSLAGVQNEFALKHDCHLSIHQQNFFMYFYGTVFNLLLSFFVSPHEYKVAGMLQNPHIIFFIVICMGVMNGLAASLILKFVSVIVKAFASAIEVIILAVMASLVLGEPLSQQDLVAGVLVMCAVYLYHTNSNGCRQGEKQG